MATATYERPEAPATLILVLSEEEALYVYGALNKVSPTDDRFGPLGEDPVYDALGLALTEAGIERRYDYAEPITG